MTGVGTTSGLAWLLGALAMVAIWGGLWWLLSTRVFGWSRRDRHLTRSSMNPTSDDPARITLVTAPGCHFCADADAAITELTEAGYPLTLETVEANSARGLDLIALHRPAMNPLVLVDDRYFSAGRLPRRKLKALLETRARQGVASHG